MDTISILNILQADLGEYNLTPERKAFLLNAINAAISFVTKEGVSLQNTIEDMQLVEMYAAYLVRKRATIEAMPRALRWALNNKLFGGS